MAVLLIWLTEFITSQIKVSISLIAYLIQGWSGPTALSAGQILICADGIYNTNDDLFYGGLNAGGDGIYGTADDFYSTTAFSQVAKEGGHIDSDADNNKDLLDTSNSLGDFSVADFVDYIQTIANFRAVNGGTLTRLDYATRMLEENQVNLEAAHGRIMDADMAKEAARMAQKMCYCKQELQWFRKQIR